MNDRYPRRVSFTYGGDQTQRLDKFLVECLPELSRSRIQALIKNGNVTIDGKTPHKTGYQLDRNAFIEVVIPPTKPSELTPEDIPLDVLFSNNDLLAINKAAGMVVHPSTGHNTGTLVHALLAYEPDLEGVGGEQRPGIVHRLDKNTSGLIIIAKNDKAHWWLQEQFRQRQVHKIYLALVDGMPPTRTGRIEAPIGRDPRSRKKMAIVTPQKGRNAETEYLTLEQFDRHTLLEVHPITGRTHQIRLHLAYLDCPVVGDRIYGRRQTSLPLKRHFLHAERLTIQLPGEETPRTFKAPLPVELDEVLNQLRREIKL